MTPEASPFAQALLGIATLGAIILVVGGIKLIRRGERQKGVLMIVAAVVLLANVLIWSV